MIRKANKRDGKVSQRQPKETKKDPNLALAVSKNDQNASKKQPSEKVKHKSAKSTNRQLFWT